MTEGNDTFELEMQLRGRDCLVVCYAEWHSLQCSATAEVGNNPYSSETWDEVEMHRFEIEKLLVWTDSDAYEEIPTNALTPQDIERVQDKLNAIIHNL